MENDTDSYAMKDFDGTVPYLLDISRSISKFYTNPRIFFEEFENMEVSITDNNGNILKKNKISDLSDWWCNKIVCSHDELELGAVVHFSLKEVRKNTPLRDIVDLIGSLLLKVNVSCLYDSIKSRYIPCFCWGIIGPNGLSVKAHQDMFRTASWNLLLSGEKDWYFWSPDNFHEGKSSPTIIFKQKSGDLIWIPEDWWHKVIYKNASICVSKNLILERSIENTMSSMKISSPKHLDIIRAILKTKGRL